jgi:hypothetical protein
MKASMRTGGMASITAGEAYMLQTIMGLVRPQAEAFTGIPDYVPEVGTFLLRQ